MEEPLLAMRYQFEMCHRPKGHEQLERHGLRLPPRTFGRHGDQQKLGQTHENEHGSMPDGRSRWQGLMRLVLALQENS